MANLATKLRLYITTPRGTDLKLEVESVTLPGGQGEFSVLPGHRPLIAALKPGLLCYRIDGKDTTVAVGLGFAEVEEGEVRVVSASLAQSAGLDAAELAAEAQEAGRNLEGFEGIREGKDYDRLVNDELWVDAKQRLVRQLN